MKSISSLLLGAGLFAATLLSGARAEIIADFDFDSAAPGSVASMFNTANFSFHNATLAYLQDEFGDDIDSSAYWTIDFETDLSSPLTVDDPSTFGFGPAPSGSNALNALFGPVFIKFDQAYNLKSFNAVLDNSTMGDLGSSHVWFLSATTILDGLEFDATVPGAVLSMSDLAGVTGIVLQGGGFYDNISLNAHPVPEPSTWGALGAAACAGLILFRRFRRRN